MSIDESNKVVPVTLLKVIPPVVPDMEDLVAEWLGLDVANGDARADTISTYRCHFGHWIEWCKNIRIIDPTKATRDDVKAYRQFLVDGNSKSTTISLKLTTIRRFYQAAVDRGLMAVNPAAEIKAPRDRKAKDKIVFLTAGEAELFFRAIPRDNKLKSLRDRAIAGLMLLEGLRRVEIERANVGDCEVMPDGGVRILIHGKGREDYIYPREDTLAILHEYLELRGRIEADGQGEPLFVAINKAGKAGARLTRIGINWIIVRYLEKAGLKKPGSACHGLRHTCGFLLYIATRDIRVVQETLRHSNIATAARYSHVVDRGQARYTKAINIELS